jgi:hypothetical protein
MMDIWSGGVGWSLFPLGVNLDTMRDGSMKMNGYELYVARLVLCVIVLNPILGDLMLLTAPPKAT